MFVGLSEPVDLARKDLGVGGHALLLRFGSIYGAASTQPEETEMILVVGGRSKIGTALIDELVAKGESVRALVRSSEGTDSLPAGVEAATGDLADLDSLRAAIDGAEKMFLLCGTTEQEVQLNRNAIDVAKEAGVGLLARSSIIGSDPSSQATFVRDHGQADAYLKESGVPHAIVRPN